MREPGGAAATVLAKEVKEGRRRAPSATIVSLVATVALLVATGLYNNAVAPPSEMKRFAELIPLGSETTASVTSRVQIQSARPVVGSHYFLDPEAGLVRRLAGGSPTPLGVQGVLQAVADGDNFVWVEAGGNNTTVVRYLDQARGTSSTVPVAATMTPVNGTLRAGMGVVAWSYVRPDGRTAIAAFNLTNGTVVAHASARAENRTLVAAISTDLFFTKSADGSDLWLLNATREREEPVAFGPGVARAATGVFFVAWINASQNTMEYYDILDRVVRAIPPPVDVNPKWVLADDLTVLIGGEKPGLLGASPRVELYDFGTSYSTIYDSIGVDFDTSPFFGYADRTVVSVVVDKEKRPAAPLTAPLLVATIAAVAATGILAARDVTRGEDNL